MGIFCNSDNCEEHLHIQSVGTTNGQAGTFLPAKPLLAAEDCYTIVPSTDQQGGPPSGNQTWKNVTFSDYSGR